MTQARSFEKRELVGLLLIFAGFSIIALSIIAFTLYTHIFSEAGRVEHGVSGCIILLFVPICFVQATPGILSVLVLITIVLAITFIVLSLISAMVFYKKIKNINHAPSINY